MIIMQVLDGNVELLKDIVEGEGKKGRQQGNLSNEDQVSVLRSNLLAAASKAEDENKKRSDGDRGSWTYKLGRIWALGPHRVGPNVLLIPESGNGGVTNRPETVDDAGLLVRGTAHLSQKLGLTDVVEEASSTTVEEATDLASEARNLESSIVSGFQLATASGPLCEEPMWGLAFSIESFVSSQKDGATGADQYGPFSSQVRAVAVSIWSKFWASCSFLFCLSLVVIFFFWFFLVQNVKDNFSNMPSSNAGNDYCERCLPSCCLSETPSHCGGSVFLRSGCTG
jgi:ribosome assembly protein 1